MATPTRERVDVVSAGEPTEARSPRTWRRVIVGLTLAVAVAVVVAVVMLTTGSPSGTPSAAAGTPSVTGATTVQRRNLVETDTESGTLSYAGSNTVYNRLSGTITWLPAVGQLIRPGYVLFRVDNKPVLLLDGTTPAYRNLDSADSAGPDILELNAELVELGYDPDGIVVDDEWQSATTAGVDDLQDAWGESETGELTLGQVVFLPGPQLVATVAGTVGSTGGASGASLVDPGSHPMFVSLTTPTTATTTPTTPPATTTTTTPGTTTSTTGPTTTTTLPATTTPASTTATTTSPTTTSPTTTTPTTPTTTSPRHRTPTGHKRKAKSGAKTPSSAQQLAALLALLKAETAQLKNEHNTTPSTTTTPRPPTSTTPRSPTSTTPRSPTSTTPSSSKPKTSTPSTSSKSPSGSGSPGGAGATEILQTTSDHLIVTVDLAATSQSEAKVGDPVTVEMPAGNTVNGRITAVSSVAQTPSSSGQGANGGNGSSSTPTVPVTIALTEHVSGAGLDEAAVSVNFSEAKATNVLSVPVTALLATSGSTYAVQEAAAPRRLIPVTTGLFAAGYVQISGAGIYPGLQVTDSQG